ncbi:MAG: DUF6429 family protein [Gammaproteobacteria bacterium]
MRGWINRYKDYNLDPVNKTKSVRLTDERRQESERLFNKLFTN